MACWIVFLVVLGGVLLVALLVVLLSKVTERVSAASRGVSTGGGDTAPGWILRCTRCQSSRRSKQGQANTGSLLRMRANLVDRGRERPGRARQEAYRQPHQSRHRPGRLIPLFSAVITKTA